MSDERSADPVAYRLQVKFSILGSDHDFTNIDAMLGVTAKHFARRGQSLEGRPVARQNVWSYWGDAPSENADLHDQYEPIGQLIDRRGREIADLGKGARLKVAVVVFAFSNYPGLDFAPDIIRQIESIGASLDVDMYGSLTGETF